MLYEDEIEDMEEIRKRIIELEKKQTDNLNKQSQELLNAADSFDNEFGGMIKNESRKIRSDMKRYSKTEEKEQSDYENFVANFKKNKTEDEQIDWLIKIATSSDLDFGIYYDLAHDEDFLKATIIKLTSEEFYKKFINKMNLVKEDDYNNITATDMKVGKLYHIEDPVSSFMENLVDLTMSFTLLRSNKITNLQCSQSLEKLEEKIADYDKVITEYKNKKIFKGSKKEYEKAIEFRRQVFNEKKEILEDLVKNNIRQVYDEKTRKLLDIYNNAGDNEKILIILEIQKFLLKYDGIFYDHVNKYTQEEKDAFHDYIDNGRFVETISLYLGEQGKKDFRTLYDFKVQAYSFAIWDAYSNLLEEMKNELPKNGMDYPYFQSYFDESLLGYISRDSLSAFEKDSVKAVYEYLKDSKDISIEFFDMYSNLRNELISVSNNNINNTEKGISK